jgi:hypothetical protein
LRSTSLSDRIAFINALSPHSSDEHAAVQKWSQEQETRAFASFNTPTVEDIPALIEVTCLKGVSFLIDVLVSLPSLLSSDCLDYH